MTIAIIDVNIFIDLIKLELINFLFELNFEIHTTREAFDQLKSEQKVIAKIYEDKSLIKIKDFTFEELSDIYDMECPSGLELADKTIFYYATQTNAVILSSDQKLRNFIRSQAIDAKDIIWLFDEFVIRHFISKTIALKKMESLKSINDRFQLDKCHTRIKL
jgi:rRNA-processing protein FCF1